MRRYPILTATILVAGVLAAVLGRADEDTSAPAAAKLTQREIAFHCLNRLAFGPRPGEVDDILKRGWMAWSLEQLDPGKIDDSALDLRLAQECPSLSLSCTEILAQYQPPRPKDPQTPEKQQAFQQEANRLREKAMAELRSSVLLRAALSRRQLQEVLVNFWRNHFNIDQRKDQCNHLAANFEQEVIRKHVFGKFEDMLLACARHPAMLVYLDNALSQKPLTDREKEILQRSQGKKKKSEYIAKLERQRGLNENYARELMELHTVGVVSENVSGGYTQRDIIEIARALTGWSVTFEEGKEGFIFRAEVHDDDPKSIGIINLNLPKGGGVEEGEEVIRRLARHPLCAHFIAWKLCRHLVNDRPADALVEKVAKKFLETQGDLRQTVQAIVFSDEFYRRENFRAKFKTPFEFAVSALRATGSAIGNPTDTLNMLQSMGQATCQCTDPTGYYDHSEAWLDPGVLVYRWQFALRLAAGQMQGITLPPETYAPILDREPDAMKEALMSAVLPGGVDAATEARARQLIAATADKPKLAAALLGILLGSPTFQEQ